MTLHVVTTNALHAAAAAFLGSEDSQMLPLSKVELTTLSAKRTPLPADTTLVNAGAIEEIDFSGNTSKGVFASSGNLVIDVTDARVDPVNGAVYSGIDAVGYWFDPPGAQAELLGVIVVEDAAQGTQLPMSKARTSELTFALGLAMSGHQIGNATFTVQADPYGSDDEFRTGTARNRHANPANVRAAIDWNVFPTTPVTADAADRDVDDYITPGRYLLDHPAGLSWQNLPAGVSVDDVITLDVLQYGPDDKWLHHRLIGSTGAQLERVSTDVGGTRTWGSWAMVGATPGPTHRRITATPASWATQITNDGAVAGDIYLQV